MQVRHCDLCEKAIGDRDSLMTSLLFSGTGWRNVEVDVCDVCKKKPIAELERVVKVRLGEQARK